MPKKIALLSLALVAMTALIVPAFASATTTEWTKSGVTLKANEQVHLEGTTNYTSATLGGFHCTAKFTMTIELTAGTHNAHLLSFTDPSPSTDCHITGFLASACGKNSLTESKLLKTASITGTLGTKQLDVSGIEQQYKFGTCLTLVLSGSMAMTLDSEAEAKQITFTSELESNGYGKMKLNGSFPITAGQQGVYGIATF